MIEEQYIIYKTDDFSKGLPSYCFRSGNRIVKDGDQYVVVPGQYVYHYQGDLETQYLYVGSKWEKVLGEGRFEEVEIPISEVSVLWKTKDLFSKTIPAKVSEDGNRLWRIDDVFVVGDEASRLDDGEMIAVCIGGYWICTGWKGINEPLAWCGNNSRMIDDVETDYVPNGRIMLRDRIYPEDKGTLWHEAVVFSIIEEIPVFVPTVEELRIIFRHTRMRDYLMDVGIDVIEDYFMSATYNKTSGVRVISSTGEETSMDTQTEFCSLLCVGTPMKKPKRKTV